MGGIGLPGGAVFIERHRIQGRWRHSLISAAGPLTNVLFAAALTAPFWLGSADQVPPVFRFALAFLALLQVTAAILNFLPVPGLDGYGVIEPWLSDRIRRQVEPYAPFGLLAVFGILWIPEVNQVFFDAVDAIMRGLGVSQFDTYFGQEFFRFWQGEPQFPGLQLVAVRGARRLALGVAARPWPCAGRTTPCWTRSRRAGPRRRRASCPARTRRRPRRRSGRRRGGRRRRGGAWGWLLWGPVGRGASDIVAHARGGARVGGS